MVDVVEVSRAVAIALSVKFGGCALPVLIGTEIIPKSFAALKNGLVGVDELAKATQKIDSAYNQVAVDHVPSPLEVLEKCQKTSISPFFELKIAD